MVEHAAALAAWYDTALGQAVFEAERQQLAKVLPGMLGHHLLQLGAANEYEWLTASRIYRRVCLDAVVADNCQIPFVLGEFDQLPIETDSIDVVVIAHVLECMDDPQAFLQEVMRVLAPEGLMIILAFNMHSLFGAQKQLTRDEQAFFNKTKLINPYRLKRQLRQVDCALKEFKTFFFRPPLISQRQLSNALFMEAIGQLCWPYWGAISIMTAQKHVTNMTPIKPEWKLKALLNNNKGYVEPTTRTN